MFNSGSDEILRCKNLFKGLVLIILTVLVIFVGIIYLGLILFGNIAYGVGMAVFIAFIGVFALRDLRNQ